MHMKSVVEQGFFHEFAFDNKALKTFVENFESVENVWSLNFVKFEFELRHIPTEYTKCIILNKRQWLSHDDNSMHIVQSVCIGYRANLYLGCMQGLKYNIHDGATVQLSGPPVRSRPPFISWAHVSIAIVINDLLTVLSTISCCVLFSFVKFRKSIQPTLWICDRKNVKFEWLIK